MLSSRVIVSRQLDCSAANSRIFPPSRVTKSPVVHPLSVQTLTKCFSRNSFVLKTIHFDGGCTPGRTPWCTPLPNLQTFQRVSKLSPFFSHSCVLFSTYQRLNLF